MGDSQFIDEAEGDIVITVENKKVEAESLQSILSSVGELRSFTRADVPNSQVSGKIDLSTQYN